VKRVGRAERRLRQGQEKVLRTTVNLTGQLDALVRSTIEAFGDRPVHAARDVEGDRTLTHTS
jgi:hypothetical protein